MASNEMLQDSMQHLQQINMLQNWLDYKFSVISERELSKSVIP